MDIFPSTDSAKNAVDMFPRTEGLKDIRSVLSSHVECCVVLYHKEYMDKETGREMNIEVAAEL
ncbi:MAG TPA: hypothetical protein GXX18_18250 [Bacillales bacterium]|nr:hypothetical protein [Bacillales bacterium]